MSAQIPHLQEQISMRLFILLLTASLLPAAYAEPTVEEYGALPAIRNMAVSPNGELVAYRTVISTEDVIRVVSLRENRVITAIDVSSVRPRDIFFVNNEQVMLRVPGSIIVEGRRGGFDVTNAFPLGGLAENFRVRGLKGRFDESTLFSLDISSGQINQLLAPGSDTVYPGQSALGRITGSSPDGKYVFMPAFYGEPQLVMGKFLKPSYALLRVPLEGSGKPRPVRSGTHETQDYFVDDKGEPIVIEEFDEADNLHRIIAHQDGDWKEIYKEQTIIQGRSFVGLTPDEKNLVVLDTSDETGRLAYFTLSLSTGVMSGPFHDREDADIVRAVADVQRVVHGLQYSGLTPTYKFFDEGLDQRVKDIQATFPGHAVNIADHSPDWKHILVLMEGSQSSGEYYLFSEGAAPRYIAGRRPGIAETDMNPIGTVTFSARDGLRIPSIITIPKDKVSDMKNLPAVVMPHGGPAAYDEVEFDYLAQALATQGYLVIMPQFRGSSGFGEAHKVAGHGEWGRKMQDDVSDAVKFFADRGMVDADRVCIVGSSYGGYAALAGGAFSPELYKCVVSINGIGDLERFGNWIRDEEARTSEALDYWDVQIAKDNYSAAEARGRSPEFSAASFTAPVLLVHSLSDKVVPVSQSESMHMALQEAGKDSEFVEIYGDDHHLSFGDSRTGVLLVAVEFIKENL